MNMNYEPLYLAKHLTYPPDSELLLFKGWGGLLKGGFTDTPADMGSA